MAGTTYKVARLNDRQIYDALNQLANEVGSFGMNLQCFGTGMGSHQFPNPNSPVWVQLLAQNQDLIDHFGFQLSPGVSVHFYRGGQQNQKSPVLDDLLIDVSAPSDATQLHAASVARRVFEPVQFPVNLDPSEKLAELRAVQESTFSRLQRLQEDLFQQTVTLRAELDASLKAKEAELDAKYAARLNEAEVGFSDRTAQLDARSEQLDARKKKLDDSDNTFARRQIRDRMLEDVQARISKFGVSDATASKRGPVKAAFFGMIILFVILGAFTLIEIVSRHQVREGLASELRTVGRSAGAGPAASTAELGRVVEALKVGIAEVDDPTERVALWIRLSLLTVGLVGSLIYYVRWQDRWASQHAQSEFQLQQFHLDVNRANWIIESCLEWRKETSSVIPDPLLQSITRGLFIQGEAPEPVMHPADQLASALMGSASKVSLDIAGNKLDFDKPTKIGKS